MSQHFESRASAPGGHVRWYARQFGWTLARNNIMVEGNTDERYLQLASNLYSRKYSKHLLEDIAVFAAGTGNQGGTPGVIERFPLLHRMIHLDVGLDGRVLHRVIALLDNDSEGNKTCHYLTGRYTNLRENYDVFVLKRVFTRQSRDPKYLKEHIKTANLAWNTLDCEIEDLIDYNLLKAFIEENSVALRRSPVIQNGAHHFTFEAQVKSDLCRWVETHAILKDLHLVVDLLQSLRYYLGLDPY